MALGLCSCKRLSNKGFCMESTDGYTICIKKENIDCNDYTLIGQRCTAAGIQTDLMGKSYHWSTLEDEGFYNIWGEWKEGFPRHCADGDKDSFTIAAANHFGLCENDDDQN